jgi:hypothetical protein
MAQPDATVNMHVCNPAPLQYDAPAVAMPSMTQAIPANADETKLRQLPCHPSCAQHTQRTNLPRAASCLSSGLDSPRASLWHRLVSLPASTVVHQCQESAECKKKPTNLMSVASCVRGKQTCALSLSFWASPASTGHWCCSGLLCLSQKT